MVCDTGQVVNHRNTDRRIAKKQHGFPSLGLSVIDQRDPCSGNCNRAGQRGCDQWPPRAAPLQRYHVAIRDDKQRIQLRPLVHAGASEAGECREHADARAEHERRQFRVLPTAAAYRYARMQMSGEHVSIGVFLRFVHADQRADGVRCVDAVDT